MTRRKIKPGLYRHVNGGMYRVLANATHAETGEKLVIYRDEKSGKVLARPYEMFAAPVDREQYQNAEQKRRRNSRVSVPKPYGSEKVRTEELYRRAMAFLNVGVMPTDNMLRAAGIDKETARYMRYKALRRMNDGWK